MFRDRVDAGRMLAQLVTTRLQARSGSSGAAGPLVLALPRGGVPVGAVVARALGASMDLLVVRKVGAPWQPELALGAVGESGRCVLNDAVVGASGMELDEVDALIRGASHQVEKIVEELRPGSGPPVLTARDVIVVDDGVATGATARAAATIARARGAAHVILATPVGPASACLDLRACFDEVICLWTPTPFGSVGRHYEHFDQVGIDEVRRLLGDATG